MPEAFIVKRWDSEICGLQDEWRAAHAALTAREKSATWKIVRKNVFLETEWENLSARSKRYLGFYLKRDEDIPTADKAGKDALIREFEASVPSAVSKECRGLLDALDA